MEPDYYQINLENWANSIIELEEGNHQQYQHESSYESATQNSAPLVATIPTYYRSRAFSNQVGINPLINAADPLLTLVTKLRNITLPPDIITLHQNICHEIKAFENKAQNFGYRNSLILAARYVICALLDEQIAIALWPEYEENRFSFVETFHKEQWQEDRFFIILDRSLQDASAHLDLLELIYLCLRLGYEGKYRSTEKGYLTLRNLTDNLYTTIMYYRDDFARSLLISSENRLMFGHKNSYFHLVPPAWLTSSIMVFLLLTLFIFFYCKLTTEARPINQFLTTLSSLDQTSVKAEGDLGKER